MFTGFGVTSSSATTCTAWSWGRTGSCTSASATAGCTSKPRRARHFPTRIAAALLRCNPDGANLEIVHIGLRNPQELAFDDYGNLFTYDNNSDSGDKARWVQIVEGGDSGWRAGYQYGSLMHHDGVPQGNRRPWNTEGIWHVPTPEDPSPAYIVPPLLHFGNGPAGLTHYPGVGLGDRYNDHFFACDFTSTPGSSKIWSLAVKPKGAELRGRRLAPVRPADGPDRLRVRPGRGVLLVRLDRRMGPAGQGPHLPRHRHRGDDEARRRGSESVARRRDGRAGRRGIGEVARAPTPEGAAGGAVRTGRTESGGVGPGAGEGGDGFEGDNRPAARDLGAGDGTRSSWPTHGQLCRRTVCRNGPTSGGSDQSVGDAC